MALTRYTDTFWYPSGVIAGNVPARVFPKTSIALAPLWTDVTGTVPLPNPLLTTGTGVLDFWAESGEYWVHLDTETFPITVGMSQEQADLSTGTASGGQLTANALDPTAVDIGAVDGYVVNYSAGGQAEPVITRVKTAPQTVSLDAAALLRTATWWLLDSAGAVIQQEPRPSNTQRRTHIVLGLSVFVGGAIVFEQPLPTILPQTANQLADLMDGLGSFSLFGNQFTPNGANRMLNEAAGAVFSRGFEYLIGGFPSNDPHVSVLQAQTPAFFRYATRATTVFGAAVNTVDVANFDSGGVLTPVGGGANTSTVQRIWIFATTIATQQVVIQYGQTTYSSLAAAVNAVGTGIHVPNPAVSSNGALVAYLAVTRTATNLSDPTQAMLITAGKFATP